MALLYHTTKLERFNLVGLALDLLVADDGDVFGAGLVGVFHFFAK